MQSMASAFANTENEHTSGPVLRPRISYGLCQFQQGGMPLKHLAVGPVRGSGRWAAGRGGGRKGRVPTSASSVSTPYAARLSAVDVTLSSSCCSHVSDSVSPVAPHPPQRVTTTRSRVLPVERVPGVSCAGPATSSPRRKRNLASCPWAGEPCGGPAAPSPQTAPAAAGARNVRPAQGPRRN